MRTEHMSHEAHELALYMENDEPLYLQSRRVFLLLAKKRDRGVYDPRRAQAAFRYVIEAAAKKYIHEYADPKVDKWHQTFNAVARREVAEHFVYDIFDPWYKIDYAQMGRGAV